MAKVAHLFPNRGDMPASKRLRDGVRIAEALLFAAPEPLSERELAKRMPEGVTVAEVIAHLRADYQQRGVHLVAIGEGWIFRTADDLRWLLSASGREVRKLSRAAMETLAIIAYHQPATRADIEDIRGVSVAKGTLDVLMETGWIALRGRRQAPGRPITYGTTDAFLLHFGLESIAGLPGLDELRGAGLFDSGEAVTSGRFLGALPEDRDPEHDEDPLL